MPADAGARGWSGFSSPDARIGAVRKIAKICLGFLALGAGAILALPGIPGPGIALMIVGLVLLSGYFEWARRLLHWARQKYDRTRDRLTRSSR